MDDKELQYKIVLIRDGIVSASYQMPKPEIFIHPFIDYLYLFFQRPLVFTFWQKITSAANPRFIYSTLKDPAYTSYIRCSEDLQDLNQAYPLHHTNYLISAYVFDAEEVEESRKSKEQKHILSTDNKTMRNMRKLLCYHPDMFNEHVFQLLSDSLAHHSLKNTTLYKKLTVSPIPMDYKKEVEPLLEGMRDVLDGAISDAANSPHLHQDDRGEDKILNVMAFVKSSFKEKHRCGFYNYTTARLLTEKQKEQLSNWIKKGCQGAHSNHDCPVMKTGCSVKACFNHCISYLQTPFCDNTRAVIDLVFSSGLVDFGSTAFGGRLDDYTENCDCEGFHDEQIRKDILSCMYAKDKGAFYIPIHVNGVPWLVLHSIIDRTDAFKTWRFNYGLYRDVGNRISVIVRRESKQLYLKLFARELSNGMKQWIYHSSQKQKTITEINKGWQKLAQVYPYPLAELSRKEVDNSDKIHIQMEESLWLSVYPNPFHHVHIDWHGCEKDDIIRRCKSAIKKVFSSKRHWDLYASSRSTHLIRTPLHTAKTMVERLNVATNKKLNIANQLDQCLRLHYFSTCMLDEEKHEGYLRTNKSTENWDVFFSLLHDECFIRIKQIVEYSIDSEAPITRAATNNTITFTPEHLKKHQRRIHHYQDQLAALWDELFSNIDRHGSREKSNILISTESRLCPSQEKTLIYLNVSNESKHSPEKLKNLIDDLNQDLRSSGTSMISLTCNVLWKNEPLWSVDQNNDRSFHISMPVGEVEHVNP